MSMSARLHVVMPEELHQWCKDQAEKENRSLGSFINNVLIQYRQNLENAASPADLDVSLDAQKEALFQLNQLEQTILELKKRLESPE